MGLLGLMRRCQYMGGGGGGGGWSALSWAYAGGLMGSNDPPSLSEVTFTTGIYFFFRKSRTSMLHICTIALTQYR